MCGLTTRRSLLFLALLVLRPAAVTGVSTGIAGLEQGQSAGVDRGGTISGVVMERGATTPVVGASVEARTSAGAVAATALTGEDGRFRLTGLEAGVYMVVANRVGYRESALGDVRVREGEETVVSVGIAVGAFALNPLIVSASRRPEKALAAPAMVAVVSSTQIEERPALTPVDHVRGVPGMDVIQQGIQSSNVVARGFNNIFSTSLHTLSDYRLASVPSLRVNLLHFVPANNEDIERIEVVLGPGAALYGPNTSAGVLHIITRSPLERQGTTASLAAGERNVIQSNFRTAHLLTGNVGLKVSGQYLQGDEWEIARDDPSYLDEAAARRRALSVDPDTRIGLRDHELRRYGAEGRLDWRVTPRTTAVFSVGHTMAARGIELTGIGAAQTIDWGSAYVQARASRGRLFAQSYVNLSDAGDTYIVGSGLPIVDESRVAVAQLQHGLEVGERQLFTYGADLIRTMPNTGGTIHGRNEDDDDITEAGVYLQSETRLSPALELVLAGRLDHHSRLDDEAIFSPRAALVFSPRPEHSFRATFNRAFSTPASFNLFLDIDAGLAPGALGRLLGYRVRAMGTEPSGFSLTHPDGTPIGMRSPFGQPAASMPVDPATLWGLGIDALQAMRSIDPQIAGYLRGSSPTDIGINALNLSTMAMTPLDQTPLPDVPRARESLNSTLEVGYKGLLGERLRVSLAVWHEKRSDFMSPLTPFTPLLFLDSAGVQAAAQAALEASGMAEADAEAMGEQVAEGMSRLPLGVVTSPQMSQDPHPYIGVSYRNFGEVSLSGADLSVTALLVDRWSLTLAGSLVDRDHFFFEKEGYLVGLNAPKRKGHAAVHYHDHRAGINGELRVRHTGSFPVSSAPYAATRCLELESDRALPGFSQSCIPAATLLDANVGYQLPFRRGTSLQLSVTNLLGTPYRSFVGVPAIGRFALLRVRHEF